MMVQTVLMDMEFDKTIDELSDRTVVNTSADESMLLKSNAKFEPRRSDAVLLSVLFRLLFSQN